MGSPPQSQRPSATRLWLRLGLSVILAVVIAIALWPYLRAIPEDLSVPGWLVPAYLVSLLPYHALRAGRWHFLVRPISDVPPRETTLVGLAGYMWIALLPFRLGELARPLLLSQRTAVRVPEALGTVAIERVVDGLAVCLLFFLGVAGTAGSTDLDALYAGTLGVMSVFAIAILALSIMARFPARSTRWVHTIVSPVSPSLADKLTGVFEGTARGLAALPSWRPLLYFILATAAYWLVNAATMWMLATGCGLDLSLRAIVTVLAVMNIALLIPGGPAQFGVFQTGVALGLSLYLPATVVEDDGSKFTFYMYVCQLGTIVALGLLAQRIGRLDWKAAIWPTTTGVPEGSQNTEPSSDEDVPS